MNAFFIISVLNIIFFIFNLVSCELHLKNTFKAHYFGINSIGISNNGDIVSIGEGDFDIKVWDKSKFELKKTIACHNTSEGLSFSVKKIIFLNNGNFISASSVYYYGRESYETRIFYKLWDFDSSKMITFQNGKSFQEVENMIKLDNENLAIVTNERLLTLRETQSLKILTVLEPFKIDYVPFAGLIELKNKDLLYGSGKTINIFDSNTFNLKANFSLLAELRYIVLLKNGDLITAESDEALRVWDQNSYKLKHTISDLKISKDVTQIIQLENEDLVLGTKDGYLNVIDSQNYELKQKVNALDQVNVFNILKNGDLVSGHYNGTISIWSSN